MKMGILALLSASVLLGIIPTANKYLLLSGMTSGQIVFYIYLMVAVSAGVLAKIRGEKFQVKKSQLFKMLLLGAAGMGGTGYLLNQSYLFIPVGLATMLHFLYPTVVSGIMIGIYKEKGTVGKIAAIFASITGMFFIADLSGGMKMAGIVFALCSSGTYAYYIIANEKGEINELSILIKLFYSALGATLVCFVFSGGVLKLPNKMEVFVVLFGICGLGFLTAFYLLAAGIKKVGALMASFFNMLEPIVSLSAGVLIYQEQLNRKVVFGCILVLLSVLLIAIDGANIQKQGNVQLE